MNSIQITNLEVLDTDGRVSRRRIVLLQHGADTLEVVEQGLVLAFWPLAHIRILAAPDRVVRLHAVGAPELSRIEITDRDVSAQLLPLCPNLGGPGAAREAGALRIVAWSVGAVVSLGLVVAYLVPLLAEKLTPIVPVALERRLGAAADNQLRTVLRAKTCNDPAGVAALDSLIERLRASDPNSPAISAEVWSTPVVNAFALPGGGIRIFRGLIENVRSPDELAGVIAHEIGHLKHRDGLRNLLRSGSTGYLLGLFFGDVAGAGVMLGVAKLVLDASYSREAETAADEHAIIILGALGRPTLPLGEFLDRVDGKRERAALLESHPAAKDRRERLRESWRASGPPLLEERQWHALKTLCKSG